MLKRLINKYNGPNTIGIISSYPSKNGEIARANAISRYSYLLSKSISNDQKLVVFCEKRKGDNIPYELIENILVVPTYNHNSTFLAFNIFKSVFKFFQIENYLVQFEFSTFGGKKIIPSILMALLGLKILGKNISFTFHQVVTNLNDLSGHLGLTRNSFKMNFLNIFLNIFYKLVGFLTEKVVVHDELFKNRLSEHIRREKIIVIPHAIGDESIKTVTSRQEKILKKHFGFSNKDKIVTVFGYRSWYKGTDWIVKTMKELSDANPNSNLKLLVAGGISPTLKDTNSYRNFDRKLKNTIKKANGSVKVTGFISEKDVWRVFAISDVIVFPYRTKMSSSGSFSLTLAYKKPFLVSSEFAVGSEIDFSKNVFELNAFSFEKILLKVLGSKKVQKDIIKITSELVYQRSWKNIANLYISVLGGARINLDENIFLKKGFELVKI